MKKTALAFALCLLPGLAQAADMTAPVKAIMDQVVANWAENAGEGQFQDYFDAADLAANYSRAFVAAYRQAEKFPAYEEGASPFDYDVITDSQDGCPIAELKIAPGAEKDGVTDVGVTWKFWTCSDDESQKDDVSEVHFSVIVEDGKPVISDIIRKREDDSRSLLWEMTDIPKSRQG